MMKRKRLTIPDLLQSKGKQKLVMLTAYDFLTAKILDRADVDIILVGDSLSMTVLGYPDTTSVGMDEMIHHTQAVARGVRNTIIVGDMPFGSYQGSMDQAVRNAVRFIKAGAHAVKIEGAYNHELIQRLVNSGIPVMGHVGLMPQSINMLGGYRVQGKSISDREKLCRDADILERAGVFCIVIEGVYPSLAKEITESVAVPTIGIGAGPDCDGQVLVISDLLGLDPDFTPKFVKKYAGLYETISQAVAAYSKDVKNNTFPGPEHCYRED